MLWLSRMHAVFVLVAAFIGGPSLPDDIALAAPKAPQKADWNFDIKPTAPPVWNFVVDVAAPAPADWCFSLDTAADFEAVEPAAWRFFACDEPNHGHGDCDECHRERLPTYAKAYAVSKASGKWIMLKVGGTVAEAEAEQAKAEKLGMLFAWAEKPGSGCSVEAEPVGVYRFAPPSGTACVTYPADYVLTVPTVPALGSPCANGQCTVQRR